MESNIQHHDHNSENMFLLVAFILLGWIKDNFAISDNTVNFAQLLVAVAILLVNMDKLYELSVKWYFKIKALFRK